MWSSCKTLWGTDRCQSPLTKLLFSTFPFWSLVLWNCLEWISCSSLTSDQSSSSSLASFVTTVLVTWVSRTVVCWGLVENDCLTAACLARTGMALLVFAWTGTPWFRLGCWDFPLWCFAGSSFVSVSSSDSSSELNGGVLKKWIYSISRQNNHSSMRKAFVSAVYVCLLGLYMGL